MKSNKKIPYSILELAVNKQGNTIADTFKESALLAQYVEELGYKRIWVAEHHNSENIASSATALVISYLANATQTIRVGSGGIMLPNHSPLIVAEQFGTLETLYPGRIDLGLGRAPGTDQATASAIRGNNNRVLEFPEDIKKLQQYFSFDNRFAQVRAIPGEGLSIPIWILGSSIESAMLAASMGLPYAFACHFAPTHFQAAINLYRENFKPSATCKEPYILACVNVVAADTDKEAHYLATSLYQMFLGVITGRRQPLPLPVDHMDDHWNIHERNAVGGKETIEQKINTFLTETGIDEIMIATYIHNQEARFHSHKIFAEVMKSFT
jgi:luciferase family oxidoreductase group 1